MLIETLPAWMAGEIEPQIQTEAEATYCSLLRKQDGAIDWTAPAETIDRQVRAFHPWPGAYTFWQGRRLRVLRVTPLPGWQGEATPGEVLVLPDELVVATGKGAVRLEEVQPAGKKPMPASAFGRGQRLPEGTLRLG